jgi:hypothetical protein
MSPLMNPKRNPKFKIALFLLISSSSVEGRDTCMDQKNKKKNALLAGHRAGVPCCPVIRVPI